MNNKGLEKWINKLIEEDKLWKFYKSKEFRHLKEEILREQHYECQECKKLGKITKADTVHHVQHVRKHPSLALSKYYTYEGKQYINLIAVCKSCHNKLHPEKSTIKKPKLIIVTGLPAAGKTTYVKKRLRNNLVYDLDYIVDAITYSNPSLEAITVANRLLTKFIEEAMKLKNINIYVIRSSPNQNERELFDRYQADYVEIEEDIEVCKSRRTISDEEFTRIAYKHKQYLASKEKNEDKYKERW